MAFKISKGIDESELPDFIKSALKKYGIYQGRAVDYTKADIAPIVMCVVASGNKFLLVKRGYGLADAEGYWSTVNGFIDEAKPVKEIVEQEVSEELGLVIEFSQVKVGKSYTIQNPKEKRAYIVFPCLVLLGDKQPKIKLDREHTEFAWIERGQLNEYGILDDLPVAIDAALNLQDT